MIQKALALYAKHDLNLTPLNGKVPLLDDWTSKRIKYSSLQKHNGNLGWVIGSDYLVIDVDPKNGGKDSFNSLCRMLKLDIDATVITPSGGFHCYMELPEDVVASALRKTLTEFPGIDFLKLGNQVAIAGSTIGDKRYSFADKTKRLYFQKMPQALLDRLEYGTKNNSKENSKEKKPREFSRQGENITQAQLEGYLAKLSPDMPHDEWMKIGLACFNHDPLDSWTAFEEWSAKSEKYDERMLRAKYNNFRKGAKEGQQQISIGTLIYEAQKADYDERAGKIAEYITRIENAPDAKVIHMEIVKEIKRETFSSFEFEQILAAIKIRLKQLTGVTPRLPDLRKEIKPQVVTGHFAEDGVKPEWAENWLYVDSHGKYYDLERETLKSPAAFNMVNGLFMPRIEGSETKVSAGKYCSDNSFVEVVDGLGYFPYTDDKVVWRENLSYVNSFNFNTLPKPSLKYTDEGKKAIRHIKRHISFMCGNDEDAAMLLEWLAFQVQHRGKKILWSPIIQGIEGVGKSFFKRLLKRLLGDRNVGTVNPVEVTNAFNGWAVGKCVNVLEELRVKGSNRHQVVNSLKPLITDYEIQVNEKGVNQYPIENVTNYICFTNFKDALPLSANDRRWWVIFTPFHAIEELEKLAGIKLKDYFRLLYDEGIDKHGAEILRYFCNYEISEKFLNTKVAPMTVHKQMMIATEEANIHGLDELKALIAKGDVHYNANVICSDALFEDFSMKNPEVKLDNWAKNAMLKNLNYMKLPKQLKIGGKLRTIWAKTHIEPPEVRLLLKGENEYFEDL